jgi:hypothetical protein
LNINNEASIKDMLYDYARNFTVGNNNIWTELLDKWYYEKSDDYITYSGNDDPYCQDIMNNPGFQILMDKYKKREYFDKDNKDYVRENGEFGWHYYYNKKDAIGDRSAYTPMTQFIGSYSGKISPNGDGSFTVKISNTTGWISGSRVPERFRHYFSGLIEGTSLYGNTSIHTGLQRGWTITQYYIFTLFYGGVK